MTLRSRWWTGPLCLRRDALEGWDAAAEPYQCTLSWDPITQRIDGTFGGVTSFQAGSRSCTYDMLPVVEDLSTSKMQLVAPARMLYGEVMIPVYSKDINPKRRSSSIGLVVGMKRQRP